MKTDALAQEMEQTRICEKVSLFNTEVKHFRGGVENATFGFPNIYPAKRFANYAFGGLHINQTTNQALSRLDKEMSRWPSYNKHTTLITKNTTNHCYLHDWT